MFGFLLKFSNKHKKLSNKFRLDDLSLQKGNNLTSIQLKINTNTKPTYQNKSFKALIPQNAINYKEQGNEYLKTNNFDKAIECYNKALSISPEYADAYFNLGKAYKYKKDYPSACQAFEKAKKLAPNDTEIIILLGETYKQNGQYTLAIKNFEKALEIDKTSDYANRNLEETKNVQYSIFNPKAALEQKKAQAQKNLNDAISIAKNYLPKGYMKDLADVCVVFDTTNEMGGRSNIAQYEHSKRKITVTGDYIWANPRIVSAYLVHEFVHAKDNDPYTSIHEEQDAYEEAAKFWLAKHPTDTKTPVKDPEMDYVGELYTKSAKTLKARVAEIYKLRDPDINETSPNHPPKNISVSATTLEKDIEAESLKSYDVIA